MRPLEPVVANLPDQPTAQIVDALRAVLCALGEPNAVLAAILRQAVDRTGADRGLLVEVLDNGAMEYRVVHGARSSDFEGDAGAFSRNLFGRVVETGKDVLLERVTDDPYFRTVPSVRSLRTAAVLCMPIRAGDRVRAVVHLENKRPGHFRTEHRDLMRSLLGIAGPVLETMYAGRSIRQERDRLKDEARESRDLLARDWSFGRFVGRSEAVRELESTVRSMAARDSTVLVLGETGTGKSLLAKVLHFGGRRARSPLITVDCTQLERGTAEVILFGSRRGVFTDARDSAGKVQAAESGTLFLDEIGDLPLEVQPKLLRLLEERTFERLGDTREQSADIRIIAATNRDLKQEVERGRFRADLLARINMLAIRIPPLRERVADIPLLLRYCLDGEENGRWIEVSEEATAYLEQLDFDWPDNVRHIQALAARLAAEGHRGPVSARDIERHLALGERQARAGGPQGAERALGGSLSAQVAETERAIIVETMRLHPRLTRKQLAGKLGIAEATLFKKLRLYGLTGEAPDAGDPAGDPAGSGDAPPP
jgi:Nif-specific regulatory protein